MKRTILVFLIFASFFTSAQENLSHLDKYPVFRGCQKKSSNEELKKCTDKKVSNFIKLGFNYELADKLFPQDKTTQFIVEFIINEKGKPEKINVKANSRELAIDVIKLIKRLPKFKSPGYINNEPVKVPFKLLMIIYF